MNAADLPNRRVEAWKYSDLRVALADHEDRLSHVALPAGDSPIRAFAKALANAETTRSYVVGEDGDLIRVGAPSDGGAVTTVVAPVGSQGVLIESQESWADVNTSGHLKLSASSTDILIEDHATLVRIVTQRSSNQHKAADVVHLNQASVRLGEGAKFIQFVVSRGAKLARIETHVSVEGEGAEVELNGVYLCGSARHADLTSVINHKVPNGRTRQLIKGVARKGGRGVFQGKIIVERGAQKTDARQYHHGMLLEDGAEIFAKPELLIHADDVQCAHGNTAGGVDESALFYLRSRGLPEARARGLLIEAFLTEAIPQSLPGMISDELLQLIRSWLGGAQ